MVARILNTFLIKLLFFTMMDANLEINQHEYSNQYIMQEDPSKIWSAVEDIPDEPIEASYQTMPISKTRSPDFDYLDTIHQETKVITWGPEDVPPPSKFIGPQNKPRKLKKTAQIGPKGIEDYEKPTCDEFSSTARFNPYSVLDEQWFNFYKWDSGTVPILVEFFIPASWEVEQMREFLDRQAVDRPVDWKSRLLVINDLISNTSALLVERDDHGRFWMYRIDPGSKDKVDAEDVRFKQTPDNKYFMFAFCVSERAFVFSRVKEVPLQEEIPDALATLAWRGRDGRSYLYQGSRWGPFPDIDQEQYWRPKKYQKVQYVPPEPEVYDPEKDDVIILGKKH